MKMLYHPKRILGFEPYVAPEGFDRKAQPVDIYDVFERYYKNHRTAKYIYSVKDTASLIMEIKGGTSYRYGYESGGTAYTVDIGFSGSTALTSTINAGGTYNTIPVTSTSGFQDAGTVMLQSNLYYSQREYFTYTSKDDTNFYGANKTFTYAHNSGRSVYYCIEWGSNTKRWVITNNASMSMQLCTVANVSGPEWLYCGNYINSIYTSDSSAQTSTIKWIHIHKLDNITGYGYCCGYASPYEGTYHISRSVTSLAQGQTGSPWYVPPITGTLRIPSNIKILIGGAFSGLTGLTELILEEGVESISNDAMRNCTGLNGTLTIPNSCTTIGNSAFQNCNKLDTLDLGTGVVTIGNSAFQACAQLTGTLTFPTSLTTIGTLAFYGCTGYTGTLTIASGITSIGQGAFGDDNFTDIDVTANAGYEDVDNVLYEVSTRTALHSVKGNTGTITFQTNTLIIGDYCCLRNQRTGTLTVPDSVTRVGIYAFYDCDGFTAISLEASSSSLATIDDYAFSHCSNLAGTLTIPNSVTMIDAQAFQDDVLITSLSLGSGLVTIGANAFRQMTAISENLVIPNSVETIGATAFYNNTARTGTLTLGIGLKTIGGQAFGNVPFTGTLAIPSIVTAIGEGAFWNNNFSAVSSAASGFAVSDYVLYDETVSGQIKAHTSARGYSGTLTFKTGTTSILLYCFYNNDNRSGAIVIPYTVTAIGQQAFDNCGGFNSTVTIGDATNGSNLTTIGYLAFRDCANITGWYIYRTPAPTCNSSFSNYAKPLHVKSGATGYDVTPATNAAPWTNTAIFSSVTYDL